MVSQLTGLAAAEPTRAQQGAAAPAAPSPAAPTVEANPAAAASPAAKALPAPPAANALPLAPAIKGSRPLSDPTVLAPAATELPATLQPLAAPASLALPDKTNQVRVRELRPLGLSEVETLAEVNNPSLKALASQVEQAQSNLRAQIALWYPNINLNANSFPTFTGGQQFSKAGVASGGGQLADGYTTTRITRMNAALEASWSLINPQRTPQIAAARDQYEQAKNQYLIGLRDLRLQAAQLYFNLQQADEQVRIGKESVRSSQVSLRDARARFQAGVATKLEVLQAETQLARDQQLLTDALSEQSVSRRNLAATLNLPQDVTPTAKDPSRVLGTWLPSLQESIVAAYTFREELDQALLDISIANSQANVQLGEVQPFLSIVNSLSAGRSTGWANSDPITGNYGWNVDTTLGLSFSWNLFDGGAARARYRQQKQRAEENTYRFAQRRTEVRQEVEESYYNLERNNRNITTTSREVISARESLRLARLRFQAGVTTQREVVDTQRDLTQAEVRYTRAIADYNRSLAELRRRTGLDQIALCEPPRLPSTRPVVEETSDVPVEPQPLLPACLARVRGGAAAMPSPAQP
ncbi:MAG: TolC family protein [Cyanobium sp.]